MFTATPWGWSVVHSHRVAKSFSQSHRATENLSCLLKPTSTSCANTTIQSCCISSLPFFFPFTLKVGLIHSKGLVPFSCQCHQSRYCTHFHLEATILLSVFSISTVSCLHQPPPDQGFFLHHQIASFCIASDHSLWLNLPENQSSSIYITAHASLLFSGLSWWFPVGGLGVPIWKHSFIGFSTVFPSVTLHLSL